MRVQLHWTDIETGQAKTPILTLPIAFGRAFRSMPATLSGANVSRMVLAAEGVEGCHAMLAEHKGQLMMLDRSDRTQVNGVLTKTQALNNGDRITIGPFEITVTILEAVPTANVTVSEPAQSESTQTPAEPSQASPPPAPESNRVAEGFSVPSVDTPCDHKVGFLFKRRCGRTTTEGCPDCRNGQIDPNRDRYQDDYAYYPGYGRYGHGYWGSDYYYNRDRYYYNSSTRNVDFNESDAASFEEEGDRDYEMDLDAS